MDGIIIVDKPPGMTSHDVVHSVRKLSGVKKVGHTGTLDPLATGVLPVCIGGATRISEYMQNDNSPDAKGYECTMKLGIITDTQDISGKIIEIDGSEKPIVSFESLSVVEVEEAVRSFIGEQDQLPPAFSAVKHNGHKLYEYAHAGKPVPDDAIKPRKINVSSIDAIDVDLNAGIVSFTVYCSKGTYIRTLCNDIGEKLGCGAVMASLRRIKSGVFTIDMAMALDEIMDAWSEIRLLPVDAGICKMPIAEMDIIQAKKFISGIAVNSYSVSCEHDGSGIYDNAVLRAYSEGRFIGIGVTDGGVMRPRKVIVK